MDTLYSLEIHTDDHIDNSKNGLGYTSCMINSMVTDLMRLAAYAIGSRSQIYIIQNEIKLIRYYSNLLFSMSVTHGHNLDILLSLTKLQLQALSELMYGRIPVMLITPEMISKVINSIEMKLAEKWPMFKVAVSRVDETCATNDLCFVISDKNIYVTVSIPMTLQELLFDVYQVITMPIGTSNDTSVGLSKISNVAEYLVMNSDESHFLELS